MKKIYDDMLEVILGGKDDKKKETKEIKQEPDEKPGLTIIEEAETPL